MNPRLLGVLLLAGGAAVGAAFARGEPPAYAQSVDNKTTRWLTSTVEYGPNLQAMMLFDSQTNRLMAYAISPTKELEVLAIRDISFDLKAVSFGKQSPTVQKMKEDWEKSEKPKEKEEKPK